MIESAEIKDLRGKILAMEMEMSLLERDLEKHSNELEYNKNLSLKLDENVRFLKNSDVAVSLPEYRKIKQHLKITESRIKFYKKQISPIERNLKKKEVEYKKEMSRFLILYKEQFESNILNFPNKVDSFNARGSENQKEEGP